MGIQKFNNLPIEIRNSGSLNLFVNNIKKYVRNNSAYFEKRNSDAFIANLLSFQLLEKMFHLSKLLRLEN